MGKITRSHQKCISPDCSSSDAMSIYEDGGAKCFSCNKSFRKAEVDAGFEVVKTTKSHSTPSPFKKQTSFEEVGTFMSRGFKDRGITKAVCEFFDVKVSYDDAGEIDAHYYPYGAKEVLGYKVRKLPKEFSWIGTSGGLFGMSKFSGGGKRLVITEGEIDALSVAQCHLDKYGKIYPAIALSSSTATKEVLLNRDWIRSFKEVVICVDHDAAGDICRQELIKIIGVDKARITQLPVKDANAHMCQNGSLALLQSIWDAAAYVPAGIMKKNDLRAQMHELANSIALPYPDCLEGINSKLKGMRLGEIALYISGTGSGKSSIIREVMLHILEVTKDDKVGIISLEESPGETARNMSAMELRINSSNEEIPPEELDKGFDAVFGDDRVIVLDHQGSIKDGSIVEQMEYMALMGCTYLFIDHITILVSEGAAGLSGNEAIDKVMNDLLRVVKKHNVHIGLVSHLRKAPTGGQSFEEGKLPSLDDIRGSGSIKQVSMDVIAFARNMVAEKESTRNAIKMSVLKCRRTGLTGPVKGAMYDHKTGRLHAFDVPKEEEDNFDVL